MGFWSGLADIAFAALDGMTLSQAHPALQKAWSRYSAKGFEIVRVDTYELTGRKEGVFSTSTVTLRVDHDGSVLVEEEGALTQSVYVIEPGPGIPTVQQFEAAHAEADANRASQRAANSGSGSHGGSTRSGNPSSSPRHPADAGAVERDARAKALKRLGLKAGATPDEIKGAHREKAREYHPDLYSNAPREFRDLAHKKMTKLNQARDLLLGTL